MGTALMIFQQANHMQPSSIDLSLFAYANKLKSIEDGCKSIETFDVVVSNPPFSISGFKDDVENAACNFKLAQYAGARSSEIECFFIERTAQLLREGGASGLILPLSILNNERSIYCEARKLLLIQFQVVGLVELGNKTFKPRLSIREI